MPVLNMPNPKYQLVRLCEADPSYESLIGRPYATETEATEAAETENRRSQRHFGGKFRFIVLPSLE